MGRSSRNSDLGLSGVTFVTFVPRRVIAGIVGFVVIGVMDGVKHVRFWGNHQMVGGRERVSWIGVNVVSGITEVVHLVSVLVAIRDFRSADDVRIVLDGTMLVKDETALPVVIVSMETLLPELRGVIARKVLRGNPRIVTRGVIRIDD